MDKSGTEIKKKIKDDLHELQDKCLRENKLTMKSLDKFEQALKRMDFKMERGEFVMETLKEFDNLDPLALDTVFEYKAEDLKQQFEDFWQERNQKQLRDGGVV